MAEISYSWISFFKKCWDFLTYLINFLRGKKQNQINNANTDLTHNYDKIDQDKEDNKQDDTEHRINDMF